MLVRAAFLFALVGCASCGAKSGPVVETPTGTSAGAATAERPPDLSPVPAPADLVLVGRLGRPRTLFETLATWSGVPVRVSDVLPPEMKDFEQVVVWDAPIELTGALDRRSTEKVPEPLLALSVGLTSVQETVAIARDRGANVTQVAPGVFRVNIDESASCAIAASLGPTRARLVCAEEWSDLEELLPYATRGMPTRDLGANDLYIELAAEPIRRRYTQEISSLRAVAGLLLRMASLDDKRFDRVLTDVAYGVADELKALANEADAVRVTGKLDDASKSLELGYSLTLRSTATESSFISQLLKDAGRKAAPPPDAFWQLPANASTAAYSVVPDPARLIPPLQTLAELTDAYLEYEKVAPSVRKRTRRIIEAYARLTAAGTYASGPVPEGSTGLASPILRSGWSVGTANQRADALTSVFADVAALLTDPEFARLLRTRFQVERKLLPRLRSSIVKVKGFEARATAYQLELPRELLAKLEDATELKGEPKPNAPKQTNVVIVLVPDGERTFVAYAREQKQAIQLLETLRAGTEKTLATVPELQALRNVRAVWGGYFMLEELVSYFDALAKQQGVDLLTRMPNHGRTPWLMRADVTEAAPGMTFSMSIGIPQGAFQDVGSLIPDLAGGLLRPTPKP